MKKEYSLQIYKPNGENTDIELRKYQYNGSFMGERNITASISSPVKINWEIGDYVVFRNEPFTLRYVPPVKKQSRRGTYGEGYIYDGIVFSSIISQLMDVQFLDYVSNDNNIHYTGLSNFAFYVSNNSLTEFASRIKANIERVYGKDSWDVIVANKGVVIKDEDNNVIVEGSSFEFDDQSISITTGTSIYNAICLINTQLELNFLIRIVNGRKTIILGGSSVATAESLGYGKGRGLKSIQQSHNNNEQIVTRLHAYGSSRNLPYRYYNKKYNDKNKYPKMFDSNGNYLLESRYINKLMLPYKCWVQTSYLWDAFIQSKLADVIGIKEGEVTFDGSDEEWDEIYPSLEKQSVNDWEVGMTMYDSGYREYSETMQNRFLFNVRQMTTYGNVIEEIKKIFSLNTKNADDREQAKSILEDCKWTVTPGKEAYYEEAMKIIDEVWDGKDWEYKYDYAVQKTHKLSSTEKSNIKKYTYNGDGRLDRLPSGASIKDNGVSSDGSYTDGSTDTNGTIINTTFEVIIPQLGFDIEDWVSQDNSKATMSIKSGMCAGREFPINSCIAVDVNDYSKGWKLNLDRHQDMEVNMIFPNSVYRLDAGDEYVLTGIYMPDVYVESAENRLYNQAVKYLSDIDHTKYTYSLDVDSKWMKEHEDVANLLYEGCSIVFNDFDSGDEMSGVGDLNIGEISVVATQVTISFNEEALPKYTIVLSDNKHTAVNLQEMISASVKSNTISYANSISLLEKKINDKLSKTEQDEAQELITFLKGIKTAGIKNDGNNITKGLTKLYDAISSYGFKNSMTAGSGWQIDKKGNAQVESIEVRSYMRVLELVMNRLSAEESEFVFTESGTVETATLNEDDGTYTLVMRKKTDKDITAFQVDDVLKGVVNDLAEPGAVGVKYYTSWVQVKEVNQTDNSIKVAVYADKDTPDKKNFNPCDLMVLHRWGNTTKKERQSCWYISSIEKRIVMLDGVTKPKLEESNYASFYGLPFDMNNFMGYFLNKNQPYLYVRGALLQDVCFIDYRGQIVKQERYRGVWSQEVANNSDDPYIVKQTTFDTVYHKNAKWQCNSTEGTKEEPSVGTTDWTMLTDGGKAIKSITEYYQVGTERMPAAISISTDGTTVTIPSGWEKTMGTTTADNRFVWNQEVIEYSNSTYSVTAVHLAGAQGEQGVKGDPGDNGEDGADGALPNLFGYDTKVECLVGHHNVVHTKTGFAVVLDSISDDDTSSDRYCLLRIKDITAGEGTYSISGYITHGRGGKFEFDCGDVTPQTMYLTANKRTRFEKKFVLPKNSYKHVDFEFFAGGYIVNIEELKIERTDNTVSECTPFVTLAHDSITQKQNILLDTNFTKTNDRTIWNVFNGDIVENAYNSLSAFHYKDTRSSSITTAVEILSQKFVGKLKPSTWYTLSMYTKVKGKVILYIGSNVTRRFGQTGKNKGVDVVLCDEYIPSMSDTTNTHQLEESTEYKRHSITFLTAPDLTNADERMYFYIWAQAEIYVTMLKLEECEKPTDWQLNEADRKGEKGDNGKTGKPLAGPTMWDSSVLYMSGKGDDEAYQSIVINPKYPKQMYLCGYSHSGKEPSSTTSTSNVDTCTEDQPWVQVAYQDFVATKVLFAAKSLIKDLNAETIEMRDSNGNRLFYLHDGQLECNVGTFKNITAIGGTFKDIKVTGNSTFGGELNGVTGSFRQLNCVDPNGKVAGGIKFDNNRMYFDGDLYSQGYNDAKKRGNRFYASDVWCRGNFGHRGKAMAVVYGDYMMAYPNGLEDSDGDRSAVRVNLTQKTTVSGKTFYEIPLYSPDSNGESNDAAGMPIDVVVFNITNTSKEWLYKFTRLSSGKEWRVFNANNNYGGLYIADTGTWRKLPGGANASYMYVPPKFLTPAMSSDIIGAGVFVSYISDIDW